MIEQTKSCFQGFKIISTMTTQMTPSNKSANNKFCKKRYTTKGETPFAA